MTLDIPSWETVLVGDCLDQISLAGIEKVQTSEYKRRGAFPVVDQGASEIAGWTDNQQAVICDQLPVVVFGDHTRAVKYIDRPFARGADGTQILKPRQGIDPLFFYFACRAINLESKGYARHFSELKESSIRLPSHHAQGLIAQALRTTEQCLNVSGHVEKRLIELKTSVMRQVFTCGLHGEAQKETEIGPLPESWDTKPLSSLSTFHSGGTPPKGNRSLWDGPLPWVSGKDLKSPKLADTIDHISFDAAKDYSRVAPAGSVLVLVRGMGLARRLPLSLLEKPMAFNQDIKALVPKAAISGRYLAHALINAEARILQNTTSAAHGTKRLTQDDLESFLVPVPSPDEAEGVANILDAIDVSLHLHQKKQALLEEFFRSLLRGLISGEIEVNNLDLSALQITA